MNTLRLVFNEKFGVDGWGYAESHGNWLYKRKWPWDGTVRGLYFKELNTLYFRWPEHDDDELDFKAAEMAEDGWKKAGLVPKKCKTEYWGRTSKAVDSILGRY